MTQLVVNNFTRGQLDHDLNGRFDLPFYENGFEICRNFLSNYKGNVKYRTGLEFISSTQSNSEAVIMEFKFNIDQSYLLEFTENKLRFYTYDAEGNFGYVVENGKIIEIETNITLKQAKTMQFAQNSDIMYIVGVNMQPKKLSRTAANKFTLENVVVDGFKFDDTGYPSCVAFYSGRLWYGGFSKKPLSVYASRTIIYDNFIDNDSITAESPLKLTLSEISNPIEWIFGAKNNLYIGSADGISVVNGGGQGQPITATEVYSGLANKDGTSGAMPTVKDSDMFYVSQDKRKVYMFDYDLLTQKFTANDLNWISSEITRGKIKKILYKRDDNNNIYVLLENGQVVTMLYNTKENILGWFAFESQQQILDICTVTRPDGKDDLFFMVKKDDKYYIERMADEVQFSKFYETVNFWQDTNRAYYNRIITEELKQCNYLDVSQQYSAKHSSKISYKNGNISCESDVFTANHVGHYVVYKTQTGKEYGYFEIKEFIDAKTVKVEVISDGYYPEEWNEWYLSFNSITGLSMYEGEKLFVVADGGVLGEYKVENGRINFDREMTFCTIGYPYVGFIKTFNIGLLEGGRNLQTTKKRISEFVMRFVNSGGVSIGTDPYDMQDVQYFNPTGFLDMPPLPMDGDESRNVGDTADANKCIYIKQSLPLPVTLTMLQYNIEFSI
jgi:hypothetical protein